MNKSFRNGTDILVSIASASYISADGGPRGYHQRGKQLPDKYLPGRYLNKMNDADRQVIIATINSGINPAPWVLKNIIGR